MSKSYVHITFTLVMYSKLSMSTRVPLPRNCVQKQREFSQSNFTPLFLRWKTKLETLFPYLGLVDATLNYVFIKANFYPHSKTNLSVSLHSKDSLGDQKKV